MKLKTEPTTKGIFDEYPQNVREKLLALRELVIQTAEETEGVSTLVETLKWGELSFVAKGGSTLRMDWKSANPDYYAMYFICTTGLVTTFKAIFGEKFQYEGNRAILFNLDDVLPLPELKQCIQLALTYHRVKDLPLLGM